MISRRSIALVALQNREGLDTTHSLNLDKTTQVRASRQFWRYFCDPFLATAGEIQCLLQLRPCRESPVVWTRRVGIDGVATVARDIYCAGSL
jgi:hypothetical protein